MLVHQHRQDFAFRGRRHRFRLRTSLMAAFSSASSAYIRFSLAFSASSSFNRLSSATEAPAYFARHWKYVALLMLCCRRISAIGTPASPCFRIATIWLSVNRDFRMGTSLAPESLPSKCLRRGEAYALFRYTTAPAAIPIFFRVAYLGVSGSFDLQEESRMSVVYGLDH